jgi:hypothetical protein
MQDMMNNKKTLSLMCAITMFAATNASAERIPFDDARWQIEAEESSIDEYLGKPALKLHGGSAILSSIQEEEGVIEFDIAVSELRGFSGARFRQQDELNFEHFYIRPHQSAKPDANQYTPVFDGATGWQLYYGEDYASPVAYRFDEWMHVKLIFQDSSADVYIDSEEPVLRVRKLKRATTAGSVGVDASNFSPAWFANFEFSPLPTGYRFAAVEDKVPPMTAETVSTWQVSDRFDSGLVADTSELGSAFFEERSWAVLDTEPTGIANFGRLGGNKRGMNTVIARLVVNSEQDQIKGLSFGYSDAVSVYVNGTRLYSGANMYESRDYRYLGTIGLFDEVYLPLKAGDNEVWFAVSEAFGGWGIIAQFDDLQGISVVSD